MITAPVNDIDTLKHRLAGELLRPGDPGYDRARTVWNGMIDRRPALIVRAVNEDDVRLAVAFARESGLVLSLRGGGHNIAGLAVCDGGLMIDFSVMKRVLVDPTGRRAWVQPGATLHDVDCATQLYGLAVPTGINSTTGIAGLTLGGGFGWLSRKYGLTSDNLTSAQIVTADGKLLHVGAGSHTDLFWALRGGGGNFGVVTEFEFALHPVEPDIFCGLMVYPRAEASRVLRMYRDFVATAPEDLTVWAVLRKAPPLPFLPPEVHGQDILVLAICYLGLEGTGRDLIAPLAEFGTVLGQHLSVQPFTAWQKVFDPMLTAGARNYWKTNNFTELKDGLIDQIVALAGEMPSPQSEIFIGHLGGQVGRVPAAATAFGNRDANFVMNVHGRWETRAEDVPGIIWARDVYLATLPYATGGAYANFLTADETERVRFAFGTNYVRLGKIKKVYDPENLFRMNQNIRP